MANDRYYSGWGPDIPHLSKGEIKDLREDVAEMAQKIADENYVTIELNFPHDAAGYGFPINNNDLSVPFQVPVDLDMTTAVITGIAFTGPTGADVEISLEKVVYAAAVVTPAATELTDTRIVFADGDNFDDGNASLLLAATLSEGDIVYAKVTDDSGNASGLTIFMKVYPAEA